jgi:membrane protein
MFGPDAPIGWLELLRRTFRETNADNGLGLAAQLAYYFFLALFPALIVLLALATSVAHQALVGQVVTTLGGVAPAEVIDIIRDQVDEMSRNTSGLLAFGVVAALWSSSAAMVAIIEALNRAYDARETRAWWKQRIVALLLTIGGAIFVLISITLVVAGPQLAGWIARHSGLGPVFQWTWTIAQWPIVFVLVATALGLIYYFAPNVEQPFSWLTPGSLLATLLWLVGSLGFRFYVVNFGNYNQTYGAIGAVMVLLLWLYISGLAIVAGAELNAELEQAAAGRPPAEAAAQRKRRQQDAKAGRRARHPNPGSGDAAEIEEGH